MKAFLAAVVAAIVVAAGAATLLDRQQKDVDTAYATAGVRLGDYGRR